MSPIKIGVALAGLRLPFRKAVGIAATLGATAVEIEAVGDLRPSQLTDTAVRDLKRILRDANLSVCALSFPTRRGFGEVDGLDRRITATKEVMSFAYRLGARVVSNRIGRVPKDEGSASWPRLIESLGELARHGEHVGATLAARTGGDDGETLARLLHALPDGGIGVDFDPGGLIINGHSATDALAELGTLVRQVRARDGVQDFSQGRGVETPLGRGAADFPALLGMLEDFGFRGYFTIDREQSDDPASEMANAVKYLKNICQ